jgi:dihydroorotate dehydrogenase electron transfer subunit
VSYTPNPERSRTLLIGEESGIAVLVSLARQLSARPGANGQPLVLLGSDGPFAFRPRPSRIVVPGIPEGIIACVPLLDEAGIGSRLASKADLPGCFDGPVAELAQIWLRSLSPQGLAQVEIVVYGPTPLMEAAERLALQLAVSYQLIRS